MKLTGQQTDMPNSRSLLYFGIAIFILAKLYLVLMSTTSLNTTRLGDDSLVYLWKGMLSSFGYDESLPALKDILAQRYLDDNPSRKTEWIRWSTTLRTTGTMTPVYDVITRASLSLGLSMKWAFALTEVLGVITMAAGFGTFLLVVIEPAAAGLGLALLAFAILPNQGIYSFIPSTMALSLSMLLWAYLLKTKSEARTAVAFIASVFIPGIHPVAKVYILMGIVIHAIGLGGIKTVLNRRNLFLYGSMGFAVLIGIIVPHLFPFLKPPPSELLGKIEFLQGLGFNLTAVLPLIRDPFIRKNALLVVLFLLALLFYRKEIFSHRLTLLVSLILGIMLVSMLHYLPGNPAELFTRLLVPFAVIAAGIGGKFVLLQIESNKYKKPTMLLFTIGFITTMVLWIGNYVFQVMNWRTEVVLDEPLKSQLQGLPEHTDVLYVETDIALQASLLQGGYRFGAIAYPMLKNSQSLDIILNNRKPEVAILPNFRLLNSLAANKVKNFMLRRHGFNFKATDYITITAPDGKTIPSLYLFLNNSTDGATIRIQTVPKNPDLSFSESRVLIQPHFKGWLKFGDYPEGVKTIKINFPEQNGWIEGVTTELPQPHIYWPWKLGTTISYHMRKKAADKIMHVQFSLEKLLAEYRAEELNSIIAKPVSVMSDDSGLVILHTVFAKNR